MSPAEYARSQGWAVGTQLEGVTKSGPTKGWVVRLEITAIGRRSVLAVRIGDRYQDEQAWHFDERDWTVTHKPARRVKSAAPGPAEAREHMAASLEWGVSPLVGAWCE